MYCCNTCFMEFDEPDVNRCGGGDLGEAWSICPYCGSDDFEERNPCILCGDPVSEDDSVPCIDAHRTCVDLVSNKAVAILKKHLSDAEYRLFGEYYEISCEAEVE